MRYLTRRKALSGLVTAGALSVAGCVSGGTDDPEDGSASDPDGDGDQPDDGRDQNIGVVHSSIESSASQSSAPDDQGLNTFSQDGCDVTVEGFLTAPDPCHAATLDDVDFEGEELSLTIDVAAASEEAEECPDVPGRVEYVATAELSDCVAIGSVSVDYQTGGSYGMTEHEVSEGDGGEDDTDTPPELVDSSIRTTATDCGDADQVTVIPGETAVSIEGVIPASNPCNEAVLTDVALSGGELEMSIGTASTLDEDEACMDCIGEISYVAEIEVTDAPKVEYVIVEHANAETHTTETHDGDDHRSDEESTVVETDLTTLASSERGEDSDWATVDHSGTDVSIEGVLPAPHPHHRAFIGDATVDAGTLTVEVIVRSTLDDEMGTQPLGQVEYEGTVTLADDASVDEVIVDHSTGGEH